MIVALTGAGGFLGSATMAALRSAGHHVRAHIGAPGDYANELPPGVDGIVADIADEAAFASLLQSADACVHLAGPASVAASFANPVAFARAHVAGTVNVLCAASKGGVERFVYVSSAEVYGRPDSNPVCEDQPLSPRSPYGAAKVGAESAVAAAVRAGAIGACAILRPFSIYGPRQRANSLLASIVRQAASEAEIVLDDLRPERDYCFVDDVADALVAAVSASRPDIAIANVGSGRGVSVGDLARLAASVAGRDVPVRESGATRPAGAEIHRLVADVERARALFAWHSTTTLADGLARCFAPRATG